MKIKLPFHLVILWCCLLILAQCKQSESNQNFLESDWETVFEKSGGTETVTYQEGIEYYKRLAKAFPEIEILEMGMTDSGNPLHLVLFSKNRNFDIPQLKKENKGFLLINNGIHPGETDGIDASQMFLRDVASGKILDGKIEDVVIAIIPFYNIGGALNRSGYSRANQLGPKEYGFRGNARNYDLNRDFIKNDTKNSRAFSKIFHLVDPDFMLDTHVSNGADYQYTLTLISPQKDKLGGVLKTYQEEKLLPFLFSYMADSSTSITPYVNVWGTTPEKGIRQFADWPRYSTGYATLFHTLAFMTETHMLKPYGQRVKATYDFIKGLVEALSNDREKVINLRKETKATVAKQKVFPIRWNIDTSQHRVIEFKGYEASYINSVVTPGQKRLFYDRSKPFTKAINYYDTYKTSVEVTAPKAYIIPQGWHNVIAQLELNQIELSKVENDTILEVEAYYISDYKSYPRPYEGHFMHYGIKLHTKTTAVKFRKGDYIVFTDQAHNRYILETLEPQAMDSFFNWNFFDTILQRKEGFSAYVFEDIAAGLLENDATLAAKLEKKKQEDSEFASDRMAQLNFIHKHSPYYEKEYLRYPIFRWI